MTVHKYIVQRVVEEPLEDGTIWTGDRVRLNISHDDGTPLSVIYANIHDEILNGVKDRDAVIEEAKQALRRTAEASGYFLGEKGETQDGA